MHSYGMIFALIHETAAEYTIPYAREGKEYDPVYRGNQPVFRCGHPARIQQRG